MNKEIISTSQAPKAIGPYSQAVKVGGMIFTSGQIGLHPESMTVVEGGIEDQTRQVMTNLGQVLKEAGAGFDDVVKTTCYLSDMDNFKAFNMVYASFFDESTAPARATVAVKTLPLGVLVEVDAVAVLQER
ncbi:RidA family protein [Saccharicrinis sp. FJH54]|uniref:RidA family protein n=1 Tax=Saccharicrinis sp. FJH54 TaxID=3344665 RepID=UPI0035D41436